MTSAAFTHVEPCPPCPRCGSYVGESVTHVCPMPSTSSVIVPGGSLPLPVAPVTFSEASWRRIEREGKSYGTL